MLQGVRQTIKAGDAVAEERTTYLLKGSASNFTAAESAQAAQHLENLGRNYDLQEAHAAYRALEESPASFRAVLEAWPAAHLVGRAGIEERMRPSRLFWLLGGSLWLLLLAVGWLVLLRHDRTPGSRGSVPPTWPAESTLSLNPQRPTLLIFAHRNCPCTRTALGELEHILAHCSDRVAVHVLLVAPAAATADRVGRDIEALARSLPDVDVVVDRGGAEARRFGVRTSGHVVLYGAEGCLLFSGGITDGRGHAGDNDGGQTVLAWLQDGSAERGTAPVYGCLLFANGGEMTEEDGSWNP
jgi:hypothetical protein